MDTNKFGPIFSSHNKGPRIKGKSLNLGISVKEYGDNYFDFKFSLQDILNRPVDLLEDQAIKNPCFKKELFKKKVTDYNDN